MNHGMMRSCADSLPSRKRTHGTSMGVTTSGAFQYEEPRT